MPSGSSSSRRPHEPPGKATDPGATELTRISGASSSAIALAWLIIADLIAL